MTNISILKLRKIPISQRLDMITCLKKEECYNECLFTLHLLSEEENIRYNLVDKTLSILFGSYVSHVFDSYDIYHILFFRCIDLLHFIKTHFSTYVKNNNINNLDMFVAIIDKIIHSKLDHHDIKDVALILEDLYVEYNKSFENYTIYPTCYLLEKVPLINKIKLINLLLSNKNTEAVMNYFKLNKIKYPDNSIIRNKIENILSIYDIIA